MHVLAANSVATLLNYLEEQLQHTPTPAQIQGTSEEKEDGEENPEGEGIEQKVHHSLTWYRRTILCFKFDPRKLRDVWVILRFAFAAGSMLCPIALLLGRLYTGYQMWFEYFCIFPASVAPRPNFSPITRIRLITFDRFHLLRMFPYFPYDRFKFNTIVPIVRIELNPNYRDRLSCPGLFRSCG